MRHRRQRRRDQHSNHYQRVHEHSTRGAERDDPDECACRGRGWILSSCDVWEQCSVHYDSQPHPEDHGEVREKRHHELYVQRCREERVDDVNEAHRRALDENRKRDEPDVPSFLRDTAASGEADQDQDGNGGLPF